MKAGVSVPAPGRNSSRTLEKFANSSSRRNVACYLRVEQPSSKKGR
ncbi:hypothetical protein L915_18201 [Phytophthora nicotianae]|uniref:Uncharacterized protein n=1 Tax=Phytophthora nicotianae TaxID=4792 RepID=W2FYM6_PHYNI|nr:hypothetical protein L915_18201 [Phytophthora nicotianae]